jgi:hypothetical protein
MAQRKISELPVDSNVTGSEELITNDSGVSRKVTIANAVAAVEPKSHTHNYEPADVDIQTHINAAHAPSNANNYSLPSSVVHDNELSSSTSSTSTSTGANSAAVKAAYDKGNHSHSYLGDSDSRISGWDAATANGTVTGSGTTSGTNTGDNTVCTSGTATTAATLATARTIAGVSFDGSANISLNNNAITNGAGYITSYTNTTYSAGAGLDLSGTTFSIESDLREGGTTSDRYWGNTHDYVFADASHGLRFYTSGAEEMRLEDDGDLHVDGDVIAYSTTVSDERLKTDIKNIDNALDKVNKLNGCTFTYTSDGKESAGLIAQEVEEVLPSAVTTSQLVFHGEEGKEYKVLQYDQTIGLLVEAIKELSAKVEELENK